MSFKVLSAEEVYRCRTFRVVRERVILPSGREVEKSIVRHPGAVVVIPIDSQGNFILESQYRHPLRETILEFPAGTLDPSEEPLACAKRELKEELGLLASDWQALGTLYPAPGFCDECQHLFVARGLSEVPEAREEDELIEAVVMAPRDLEKVIINGQLQDSKSIAAFARLQLSLQAGD